MRQFKKPLILTTAALVLVAAAVLGILSAVKTAPWELTYHLVPSDVTSVMIWKGAYSSQLTQDEIIQVVHLMNQLEKSSFNTKYSHVGAKPAYGVVIQCGSIEIRISQTTSTHGSLVMTFDATTAKSFSAGQWYINSDNLSKYIDSLSALSQTETPQTK